MNIDLLIASTQPIAVASDNEPRLLALERMLARGDALTAPTGSLDRVLRELYRAATEDRQGEAALSLLGDGGDPASDEWLRVDPVCLRPTRTRLTLAPLAPGDLTMDEASELTAALAPHLTAAGYELQAPHPQRWYVRCRAAPRMRTRHPSLCAGELSEDHLPAGPDAPAWRRLITEAQMLLYELPVNVAREAAGKLPANAIWPWGGGPLPQIEHTPYACVFANDPLARGLARATRAQPCALPQDAAEMLTQAAKEASNLIVLDATQAPMATQRLGFETQWFAPLSSALAAGKIARLRILLIGTGRGLGRELSRAHLRRWWRRARPVHTYA